MFNEIAENWDEYTMFHEAVSTNLEFGIHEDSQNTTKLVEFLMYHSAMSEDGVTSPKDYATRMRQGLKDIYYITDKSKKSIEKLPFLEQLKKKGYNVLYMVDAIDGYAVGQLKGLIEEAVQMLNSEGKPTLGEKLSKVAANLPAAYDNDKLSKVAAILLAAYDTGDLSSALEEGHTEWQK